MSNKYTFIVDPLIRSFRPEILKYFGNVEHVLKEDATVVTELDKSIEKRIRDKLSENFPDIGFNGEEYGKSGNPDTYWLIDPIDGTQNFIRGINAIGTILGLVENGKVIYTAIYNPIDDEMFIAEKGKGVELNGKVARVSSREIHNSFIETASDRDDDMSLNVLKLLRKKKSNIIRSHGAADRVMAITGGKIEGTVRLFAGGHDWDYAPGNMMMREAGAIVTYYDSKNELESRTFSVLSPEVYKEIAEDLKEIINV